VTQDPTAKNERSGWFGVDAALRRAAKRARDVARRTGTPLVLWRDGKVVHVHPDELELADRVAEDEPGPDDAPPASQ